MVENRHAEFYDPREQYRHGRVHSVSGHLTEFVGCTCATIFVNEVQAFALVATPAKHSPYT